MEKPGKRARHRKEGATTTGRVVAQLGEAKLKELLEIVHKCTIPPSSASSDDGSDCCAVVNARLSTRLSCNQKGYVQLKVKTPKDTHDSTPPNCKVQLHQLLAWTHPDPVARATLRAAISNGQLEISHLCENKACATYSHLCAEDSWTNKTRLTCEVVVYVGGVEYCICRHQPACVLTPAKQARAFHFHK
jgi:hypothetical protein